MALSTIVISYNTRETTLRCLAALVAERPISAEHEVIVVDNASHDGSADAVAAQFPQIRLVRAESNLGFGPANNRAMATALGTQFLLLNSDAFVHARSIELLEAELARKPNVGMAGPRLQNSDGSLQPSAWPFPSPVRSWVEALGLSPLVKSSWSLRDWRRWSYDEDASVPWLIGACLLVRRDVVDAVGGFDESFFLYAEETDWSRRVREAGCDIRFVARATVTHLGGASGMSEASRTRELFFSGNDRYLLKHHGVVGLVSSRMATACGALLRIPLLLCLLPVSSERRSLLNRVWMKAWLLRRQLTNWQCLRIGPIRATDTRPLLLLGSGLKNATHLRGNETVSTHANDLGNIA